MKKLFCIMALVGILYTVNSANAQGCANGNCDIRDRTIMKLRAELAALRGEPPVATDGENVATGVVFMTRERRHPLRDFWQNRPRLIFK